MRWLALAVLLAMALAGGYWWVERARADRTVDHETRTVRRGDVEDSVTALGRLEPRDYVDVGTQVSGQLRRIHVRIGDEVASGDLLAELDPAVYAARVEADRAQLRRLQAQLAEKEAQRTLAQQQFRRQAGMLQANATSREAYESAQASLRIAEAQIEALKAEAAQTESTLKADEANLGYTKIYAPMSGTVVSLDARQGQTLNANQQTPIILRIADLETMTVWTQVSEADVGKLRIGMNAYFTILGDPERKWEGKLRQVLPTPEIVNNVVLYNALFDVPNPDRALKTQMTAQVFFLLRAARDVLVVPVAALALARPDAGPMPVAGAQDGRQHARVRVISGDRIEEREIALGVSNRVEAEVVSGLDEGDRVILRSERPAGAPDRRPMRMPRI